MRSDEETLKNVELLASVATALARYDFPVPGGYEEDMYLMNMNMYISTDTIASLHNISIYCIYYIIHKIYLYKSI